MSNSTSIPAAESSEPVEGMSIFWPLLTLALASCLHPLGSVCGESPPQYRHYIRTLPLSGLLDSAHFLVRCCNGGSTLSVIARLDENNPNLIHPLLPVDESRNERLGHLDVVLNLFVDFKARVFPNVFIIFAYAKLCTFSGVPVSLVLGSVYFFSWFIMEAVLVAQYFARRDVKLPKLRQALARPRREGKRLVLNRVQFLNRVLIALQIITYLTLAVIGVFRYARRDRRLVVAHSTFRFPVILAWLFAPTRWGFESALSIVVPLEETYFSMNFFLGLGYLFFILGMSWVFSIIFMMSTLVLNVGVVGIIMLYPFWALFTLHQNHAALKKAIQMVVRVVFVLRSLKIFSFLLFGGSMLYYVRLYNPTGTSKRAWSDVLG